MRSRLAQITVLTFKLFSLISLDIVKFLSGPLEKRCRINGHVQAIVQDKAGNRIVREMPSMWIVTCKQEKWSREWVNEVACSITEAGRWGKHLSLFSLFWWSSAVIESSDTFSNFLLLLSLLRLYIISYMNAFSDSSCGFKQLCSIVKKHRTLSFSLGDL